MAEEIAPGCQDPELIGRARRIAEAQVDLMRVGTRPPRHHIGRDGRPRRPARHRPDGADRHAGEASDPGADKRVATLSDIGARLAKLDWYERVALSRRKRAIRAFDSARRRPRADAGRIRYYIPYVRYRAVGGGFCGNELILEFLTKSMPSGVRAAAILEGTPLGNS